MDIVGSATIEWTESGRRVVTRADPLIRVTEHLFGLLAEHDGTLRLDSAGEYRYRPVENEPDTSTVICQRIEG